MMKVANVGDPNIRQAAVDRMRGVAERRAEEDEE